jgi:FtsH-binding integral membrane protein
LYNAAQPYHGFAPAAPASSHAAQPPAYGQPPAQHAQPTATDRPSATQRTMRKADAAIGSSQRVRFIRLTYLHLFLAILAFAGLLRLFMTNEVLVSKVSVPLVTFALGGRWNWGVVLAAFMAVSWVADQWASHTSSRLMQYAGLAFYVLAEALIFVPLLAIVAWKTQEILARGGAEPHIIRDAAFVTIGIFTTLTFSVVISNKDFSFLRGTLAAASGAALSLIGLSLVFGFNLGLVFSVAMVLLAAGYVLFQTSRVLAHYHPGQHVAAALALFSSVALMFWYVIRIFLRARQ